VPELPEVETVARYLREMVIGKRVVGVEILDERFAELEERHELVGRRVEQVGRRGKYLSLVLDDGWVLQIHLMMAGRLLVRPEGWEEDRFLRLLMRVEDGLELRFCDMRRFGRVGLMDAAEYRAFGRRLGPEPLSGGFTAVRLRQVMKGRKTALKSALLNQKLIAGIGNIYADEALWRGRLHPLRTAGGLSAGEAQRLHRGIRKALREGLAAGGTTFSQYRNAEGGAGEYQRELRVFQRTGEKCFRCRGVIERIVVGGRSTHFCPRCQPESDESARSDRSGRSR